MAANPTPVRSPDPGVVLAKGKETRVWGRYVNGPGSPLKGETIPDELKSRFRA